MKTEELYKKVKTEGLQIKYVDSFGLVLSGFLDPKKKTIFVNKNLSHQEQNFCIAHELGHWVLGHKRLEEEADDFAREVLH